MDFSPSKGISFSSVSELLATTMPSRKNNSSLTLAQMNELIQAVMVEDKALEVSKIRHNGCLEWFQKNFGTISSNDPHSRWYGIIVEESLILPKGEIWLMNKDRRVLQRIKINESENSNI